MPTSTAQDAGLTGIDSLLAKIEGELAKEVDPHFEAMQILGTKSTGAVLKPYDEQALALRKWEEHDKQHPGDPVTWHHLAICYHARAIDLEAGKSPQQSDADWKQAHRYWRQLHQCDAFWQRLTKTAAANATAAEQKAVEALRDQLPVRLLRMHYDVAYHEQTKNYRAQFHLKLARESPFEEKFKTAAQDEVYDQWAQRIDTKVWKEGTREASEIQPALDLLEKFLQVDPHCVRAAADALKLEARLLRSRLTDFQASSDVSKKRAVIVECQKAAAHWRKYFEPLVRLHRNLAPETADNLFLWFFQGGQMYHMLGELSEAIEFYSLAKQITTADSEGLKICDESLRDAQVKLRVDKATDQAHAVMKQGKWEEGRVLLTAAIGQDREESILYFLRCQCYMMLRRLTEARADLTTLRGHSISDAQFQEAIDKLDADLSRSELNSGR